MFPSGRKVYDNKMNFLWGQHHHFAGFMVVFYTMDLHLTKVLYGEGSIGEDLKKSFIQNVKHMKF